MAVRVCTKCKSIMGEGYIVGGGHAYYCSDDCLHTDYTPEQWADMYDDNQDENYYSLWYDCNVDEDDIQALFNAMLNGQEEQAAGIIGEHYEDDRLDIYKGLTALLLNHIKEEN